MSREPSRLQSLDETFAAHRAERDALLKRLRNAKTGTEWYPVTRESWLAVLDALEFLVRNK